MPDTDVDPPEPGAATGAATAVTAAPPSADTPGDPAVSDALRRSPGQMPYRPALDGIRAIAVTAVVLYHAGVSWLPGGFLGVDVFFVLSGYLITELFLRERSATGGLSLTSFWARRGRRLLPALYAMVLVSGIYARFVAERGQRGEIRGDGIATMFYVANWWYAFADRSYFSAFGPPSPLRHTWSLSIEEQFYLVYPLLVVAGLAAWGVKRRRWIGVLLAAAVASAAWMAISYVPDGDPSRDFYSTFTRAQALLIGAALAWVLHRIVLDRRAAQRLELIGAVGLVAVVGFFVVAHDGNQSPWLYRGGFFLVALSAAALVAAASRPPEGPLTKALAVAPLVALGRVSYGVYVWHWPIFVWLWPTRVSLDGAALLAVRLGVTAVVAVASYHLLEQPVRRWTASARTLGTALGVAGVVTLLAFLVLTAGGVDRDAVADAALRAPSAPTSSLAPGDTVRVFVAGDSMAFSLAVGGFVGAAEAGAVIDSGAVIGCGLLPGQPLDAAGVPIQVNEVCEDWRAIWQQRLGNFDPEVALLLTGAWDVWDRTVDGQKLVVGSPAWIERERAALDEAIALLGAGGTPVVLGLVPCAMDPETLGGPPVAAQPDKDRIDWLNDTYRQAAAAHPGQVTVVDFGELLCPDGTFTNNLDGVTMTDDGVHFTPDGAAKAWAWLTPQLAAVGG